MKRIVFNIVIIIYFIITIFVTSLLLSYNDFNVAVFNGYSLVTKNNGKSLDCDNSLLVIKNSMDIKEDDNIYYYDTYDNSMEVKKGSVQMVEVVNDKEMTITLDDNKVISSEYVIGTVNNTYKYAYLGTLYSLFTSRMGFLFIIIFPMAIAFIYEIYAIMREFKK